MGIAKSKPFFFLIKHAMCIVLWYLEFSGIYALTNTKYVAAESVPNVFYINS